MKEPTAKDFEGRGTAFLEMYLYPHKFLSKYAPINNCKDWNYFFYREKVKANDQDYFTVIKTSQHCYAVTHYRVLDGFNELKKFYKLFDVAMYLAESAAEFDRLYAEEIAKRKEAAEMRRLERDLKKAIKYGIQSVNR